MGATFLLRPAPRFYSALYNIAAALKKSDKKSGQKPVVTSSPLSTARKGQLYSYAMDVTVGNGPATCTLEAGPDGMKVTRDGKVTWTVPAEFAEKTTAVIIMLTDADGQGVYHAYNIEIE